MTKAYARSIGFASWLLLQAGSAAAQPSDVTAPARPPLTESLAGDARADYESGKLLFSAGDHASALIKFKSAYDASSDPRLLWNMAACEKNLRHYSRAVALLRRYTKEGESILSQPDKDEANGLVEVMAPLTAQLRVSVSEPGAEVFIDDEPIGTSPVAPVVLDIGIRRLRVRKPDFEEVTRDVSVSGAATIATSVNLVRIVHQGTLNVRATAGGAIFIDEALVGTGTWSGKVASGGHTLRVTADKMRPFRSEVFIQDNQTREIPVVLEPEPSRGLPTWAWVIGGAVVAGGLATAGYFVFRPSAAYEGPSGSLSPGIVQASRPLGR